MTILFLVPAALLMKTAAKTNARAAHAARHGFIQLDNEEGALLYQAIQIRKGESIYHTLHKPPYIVGTYTPLFMAAVAALDDFAHPGFTKGRIVVWGAALGISCLLILLITTITRNAVLGILGGTAFFATFEVYRWIGYFRVDFPALFLTLAGLSIIVTGKRSRLTLIIGALILTLALYTKQTTIAVPMACLISLCLRSEWKQSLTFAGFLLLFGIIPLIILQLCTDGQFLKHIIYYNSNTFSKADLLVWIRHAWNIHTGYVLGAGAALPWLLWLLTKSGDDDPVVFFGFWQPVVVYGILTQWNIAGAAKAGSAENYIIEPFIGWILLITLAAGGCLRWIGLQKQSATAHAFAVATLLAAFTAVLVQVRFIMSPFAQNGLFSIYINPSGPDFHASQVVRTKVRTAKNPLTELAIFPILFDKSPVIQPFIMSELARQGHWDQKPFVEDLKDQKFDLVVTQQDVTQMQPAVEYTSEMLRAFRDSYELSETVSSPLWTYYILRPKSESDTNKPISDMAALTK